MTIAEWLKSEKNYRTGVFLYKKHNPKSNLIKLFESGENSLTRKKLYTELNNLRDQKPAPFIPPSASEKKTAPPEPKYKPSEKVRLDLPESVLKIDRLREISFKEMSHLQSRLSNMKTDAERYAAAKRIDELDLINDECWFKLDYYTKYSKLPESSDQEPPIKTIRDVVQLAKNIPTYLSKINKKLQSNIGDQERDELIEKKVTLSLRLQQIDELMDKEIYAKT